LQQLNYLFFSPPAEERDTLEPVLRQLAEVKQEQSRASALLDAALEGTRNLSGEG